MGESVPGQGPGQGPGGPLQPGQLLVATPALQDPHFIRAVVLLLDHDDTGSLGVVLNKPSPVPVHDVLGDWHDLAGEPPVLFHGGPVSTDSALCVASLPASLAEPVGWRRLFDRTGILDLDTPTELVSAAVSSVRIFAGYAGWGTDQLAAEIDEGSWYLVPSIASDVFGADAPGLWKRVLRRQPGELAWVSTRPVDPTHN